MDGLPWSAGYAVMRAKCSRRWRRRCVGRGRRGYGLDTILDVAKRALHRIFTANPLAPVGGRPYDVSGEEGGPRVGTSPEL